MTTSADKQRWKYAERKVGEHLGGKRVPVNGRGDEADVDHDWLAIEVKSRNQMNGGTILEMMAQAEKAATYAKRKGKVKLPIGVFHVSGTNITSSLVFMKLRDFEEYFMNERPPAEDEAV